MYQFMNIKKYRVRFVSPRKTVVVYAKCLDEAKFKACQKAGRMNPVEIRRV
jgi:hypothetical protein